MYLCMFESWSFLPKFLLFQAEKLSHNFDSIIEFILPQIPHPKKKEREKETDNKSEPPEENLMPRRCFLAV